MSKWNLDNTILYFETRRPEQEIASGPIPLLAPWLKELKESRRTLRVTGEKLDRIELLWRRRSDADEELRRAVLLLHRDIKDVTDGQMKPEDIDEEDEIGNLLSDLEQSRSVASSRYNDLADRCIDMIKRLQRGDGP